MTKKIIVLISFVFTAMLTSTALSQSAGTFNIEKSVISGGGGQSSGGAYTLDATVGQAVAGTSSVGAAFELTGGFWGGQAAPVSSVTVSGRVLTPGGLSLRNAIVTMTDPTGIQVRVTTSSFGIFTFGNVMTGQSYIISVSSKRYRFLAQIIPVNGSLTNIEFFGLE